MSNENNKKPSIFEKMIETGHAYLDSQIFKAKTTIINSNVEDDFYMGKAVVEDPSYSLHSQGWTDKPYRIQNGHLKQMSYQDSAIAAVIQTRQNQVARHSTLVKSEQEKGFMICIKDEDALLEKIKEELRAEMKANDIIDGENPIQDKVDSQLNESSNVEKAELPGQPSDDETSLEGTEEETEENKSKSDDEVELLEFELERKAKEILNKKFEKPRKLVEQYIINCGHTENRPFESLQWNFESFLRAITRDSLTYDMYATEKVPDKIGRIHHFFPVDGGTIKKASRDLKNYKDSAQNFYNIDILYPERGKEAEQKQKVIELNQDLLDKDAYKWVQVIRGKIERAYTSDELAVGIRNKNTDIYNNGYGIGELELLVAMVTGHLNAEYYNQAYFTQGFSAKGILHIKAALNRRKVESVRMQWHHMLKGSRNSFQTPIFAGVEDVKWVPLTQNHNDIGFEGWMRYLVTMIGAIYQIDPSEMGIHFKAEGSSGLGGAKDDTKEKNESSKDRGLYPLLMHFQNYINEQIIKPFDARFTIKFTGCKGENASATLNRQKEESKFKKTLNEIRAEDGLRPLPGGDDIILGPEFMQWYTQFSPKALEKQDKDRQHQQKTQEAQMKQQKELMGMENGEESEVPPDQDIYGEGGIHMNNQPFVEKSLRKSKPLVVEVYKIED